MPPDVRKHWRDPRYWEWWWREIVRGEAKLALAVIAAGAALLAGFLGARGLGPDEEQASYATRRVVTVVRTLAGERPSKDGRGTLLPPRVVTTVETITRRPETGAVTVREDGRTVVVRRPGERVVVTRAGKTITRAGKTITRAGKTITRPGKTITRAVTTPGPGRIVTTTRTDTVVQTATTDRAVTVTGPGATRTVMREVTTPPVTETQFVTVTQPVTVTEEITVTDLITVTVPSPPLPPTTGE